MNFNAQYRPDDGGGETMGETISSLTPHAFISQQNQYY